MATEEDQARLLPSKSHDFGVELFESRPTRFLAAASRADNDNLSPSTLGQPAGPKLTGKGWRPFSLKPPYLLLLACISLVLLGVTEHLRRLSHRDIGIYHAQDTDSIPKSVFYAYNNGPALVVVLYGTMWTFVDLDVRRLEPYFQLSRPRNIPAKILFLDYTFKNMFKVPVRAVQNAHWTVAAVAFFHLLVTLTLPPLMSGLIFVKPTNITEMANFDSWQTLVSLSDQQNFLPQAAEVIDHAGSVAIDGAALPSYVDSMYAVAPFERSDTLIAKDSETWTAETNVYFAEPQCKGIPDFAASFQANVELVNNTETGYISLSSNFNDTRLPDTTNTSSACRLTASVQIQLIPQDSPGLSSWPQFTAISNDSREGIPNAGRSLLTASIPSDCSPYMQLGVVVTVNTTEPLPLSEYDPTGEESRPSNVTSSQVRAFGVVCSTTYHKASSVVTVAASNRSVISIAPVDQTNAAQMNSDMFDSDSFEFGLYGLSGGLSAFYDFYVTGDNSSIINSFPILSQDSLASIAIDSLGNQDTVSSDVFTTALQNSYRLAFALALPKYLDANAEHPQISGSSQVGAIGLFATEAIAIIAEIILASATVLSLALIVLYHRRSSILRSDPDSLATMCGLIAGSFTKHHYLAGSNKRFDDCPTSTLLQAGENSPYYWTKEDGEWRLQSDTSEISSDLSKIRKEPDPLPFCISDRGFGFLVFFLLLCFAALGALLGSAIAESGFSFAASGSAVKTQVIWSFFPALVATLLELVWSTSHRDLTTLEPFYWLHRGPALASTSLNLRYASRPPIAVLWSSLSRRHFLIAFVAFICISNSLLNVALGGLFTQSFVPIESNMITTSTYGQSQLPSSWNSADLSIVRAFDLVRTNVTDQTPLPPWTDDSYSFLPVVLQGESTLSNGIFQVTTPGIGAKLSCSQYDAPAINQTFGTVWNYTLPGLQNSSDVLCSLQARSDWNPFAQYRQAIVFLAPRKQDFQSIGNPGLSTDYGPTFFETLNECRNRSMIVAEWWGNVTGNVWAGKTTNNTALACQPQIEVETFNVTVDQYGVVQSYEVAHSNPSDDPSQLFQNIPDFLANFQSSFSEAAYQSTNAGDESFPYDWPGLLTARLHYIKSPNTQLEDNSVLGDYASQVYARTFSHWFSLYRDRILQRTPSPISQPGTVTGQQARMVPSRPFFIIAFALLGLQLCGSILIYMLRRARCSGPRMPKSLGSIIPWVVHSRMLDDFKETQHTSSDELNRLLENMGKRYGFGKFVDEKGNVRLGIEEEAFLEKENIELATLRPMKRPMFSSLGT